MKRFLPVVTAFLGITALAVLPSFSASAATVHTPQAASAPVTSTVAMKITPGAHAFSMRIPITPAFAHRLVRQFGPDYQILVKPRVYCNGGSTGPYSGFNANIKWGGNGNPIIPAFLDVWGQVWDGCGGTADAYLAYTNGLSTHNDKIGTAVYFKTTGVDVTHSSDFATYGNIKVDVCELYNGWRCGKPLP
jgi:hypothetical protein